MITIGVSEGADGTFSRMLETCLAAAQPEDSASFRIVPIETAQKDGADILAVAPDGSVADAGNIDARILVAPGDRAAAAAGSIRARQVVTYGPGARDTVTISAAGGDRLTLALLREINTARGTRVGRQETDLALPGGASPAHVAGAEGCAAVLLAAGVSPAGLTRAQWPADVFTNMESDRY